jgi:hypothetical protein
VDRCLTGSETLNSPHHGLESRWKDRALVRYLARTGKEKPCWPGSRYNPATGYFDMVAPVAPQQAPPQAQREPDNFWTRMKIFCDFGRNEANCHRYYSVVRTPDCARWQPLHLRSERSSTGLYVGAIPLFRDSSRTRLLRVRLSLRLHWQGDWLPIEPVHLQQP